MNTLPESCLSEPQHLPFAVKWWMPRHKEKLEAKKGHEIDLLFVGDSITHNWETTGSKHWKKFYAPRRAFNLGFGGDRTEQVLWRLEHGAVEAMSHTFRGCWERGWGASGGKRFASTGDHCVAFPP